jgi:hypothetical protein
MSIVTRSTQLQRMWKNAYDFGARPTTGSARHTRTSRNGCCPAGSPWSRCRPSLLVCKREWRRRSGEGG